MHWQAVIRNCLLTGVVVATVLLPMDLFALQKSIRFERYSTEDGLSHNSVYGIVQDSYGYLWFATQSGLNKFDGYTFTVFKHDPDNPKSLADNECRFVFVDSNGDLWIGTRAGLDKFNRADESFTHFRHDPSDSNSLSSDQLTSIAEDKDGNLWIGTVDGGLNKFDPVNTTFTLFQHEPDDPSSISPGAVSDVHLTSDHTLWIGTRSGRSSGALDRFNPETNAFTLVARTCDDNLEICSLESSNFLNGFVERIYEDRDGRLWITNSGLSLVNRQTETLTHYRHDPDDPDSLSDNTVLPVLQDRHGNFWVGTYFAGLNLFIPETGTFDHYRHDPADPKSLGGDGLWSIYEAADGTIWIGTAHAEHGLNKFSPSAMSFGHYKHDPQNPDSLSSNYVLAVAEDHDGNLWVGTEDSGLNRIERSTGIVVRYVAAEEDPNSIPAGRAQTLHVDQAGNVWSTFESGRLTRYIQDSDSFVTISPNSDFGAIKSILEEPGGALWLAATFGITRYDVETGAIQSYKSDANDPDSLNGTQLGVHHYSDAGAIWVGSFDAGLQRLDAESGKVSHFLHDDENPNSIAHNNVNQLLVDHQGIYWISTGLGLDRFNPTTETFEHFTADDGLPGATILMLTEDLTGNLWISTAGDGVSRFNTATRSFQDFDRNDGLQSDNIEGTILRLSTGEIVLGGGNGLNIFYPDEIERISNEPPIVLTNFSLLNQPVPISSVQNPTPLTESLDTASNIVIEHSDYLFSFEFAALNFATPADNRYAYMLQGFDKDWIETSADLRVATYTNVPPGSYRFRVKGSDRLGTWNEMEKVFAVTVLPPFWRTWWAYTTYAIVVLATIFLIITQRTAALNRRAKYLEQEVADRTREIKEREQLIQHQADHLQELLQIKDKLITNISHEFRTPLTLILGPVQRMLKKPPGEIRKSQLQLIRKNGQRLLRLVNQLLGLSRLDAEEPETRSPQPLLPLVESITDAFQPLAKEKGIDLEITKSDDVWVSCSPDSLEKIILNLLSNAIKFTPDGGQVNVRLAGNEDIVELTVADTGIGIPEEEHEAVFERFHRVADSGESVAGSGIGLALVKELAEAYDGTVTLDSTVGTGTIVSICLPLYRLEPTDKPPVAEFESPESIELEISSVARVENTVGERADTQLNGRPSILIIEDNIDMQVYVAELLSDTYHCIVASNGEDGISKALNQIPDLVVCDVMLPIMDGYAVSQELKKDVRTSHIPIIMLTARGDQDSRLKGLREKVDDYITKPFHDEELRLRIDNLLEIRRILRNRFNGHFYHKAKSGNGLNERENGFLKKIDLVMEKHFANPEFGLTQMSSQMALSTRQLQRKVKALTDHNPVEYLRAYRLKKAVELLKKGMQVGLVAEATGFSSPTYFAACFKAQFGTTATEYQQKLH